MNWRMVGVSRRSCCGGGCFQGGAARDWLLLHFHDALNNPPCRNAWRVAELLGDGLAGHSDQPLVPRFRFVEADKGDQRTPGIRPRKTGTQRRGLPNCGPPETKNLDCKVRRGIRGQ